MKDASNFQVLNSPNERPTEKTAYLSAYDKHEFGEIHDQPWAKGNVNKFNNSMQMTIHQCTVCREAWPIRFKPKRPENYICSGCAKDKNLPSKFSDENKMIPCGVPPELQNLTQTKEMLISRALPIMQIYIKAGGQRGYPGHCINLPQHDEELATTPSRYPRNFL